MSNPPLNRHESLVLFSRDHHVGLVLAHRLLRSADGASEARRKAVSEFVAGWEAEIAAHFLDEERLLLPLMTPAQVDRVREEHAALRSFAADAPAQCDDPDPAWVRQLGQLLHDHIRWEERELFVELERSASPDQLQQIGRQTARIESTRPRHQQ